MVTEAALELSDGRTLHYYDTRYDTRDAEDDGRVGSSGVAEQRAALGGRAALEAYLPSAEFDPDTFTPGDYAALEGGWSWFGEVVGKALEHGSEGVVEDLLAGIRGWGFALADITVPVLILHGAADRMVPAAHGEWLVRTARGRNSG